MGCGSCSTGGGCSPAGCKSNGSCLTNGCSKLDVYDWLSHMDMPTNYKPFPVIEVKFKGSRKEFYLNSDNIYLEAGELVAVEATTGGYDIGHVSITGELVRMQMTKRHVKEADVVKKIYRKATVADVDKWKMAKDMEWETMHKSRKLALELNLSMKLSDVDYQGDKTKATFYYTAEGRVDFRELIKKMAETFRIRIEMRQIGMRQEASRLGGIGSCGRELCCSTWLTDFKTVSTSAARYQNLSLNTLKLAGQCGKLKCCLNYELDTYMDALKHIPDNVNVLKTEKGDARLQKTDIFKKIMWFSYPREESWVPMPIAKVKEIQQQNREGIIPADLGEMVELENAPAKALDYENVVGQDSLTRLDDRNRNKNQKRPNSNNNNNNNRNRNQKLGSQGGEARPNNQPQGANSTVEKPDGEGNRPQQQGNRPQGNRPPQQQGPRPPQQGSRPPQQGSRPQGNRPPQEGGKPQPEGGGNNNRRNRPNRPNNPNRNNNNENKPPQDPQA
ncbi:Cell fate regulator YaaT, PSP1 superfamily (controls sporulation, competence, biofilm development) [Mucilaginibacter pineti]|uniref:Cell fate regulator YaaT, PSP1 superfamily (Controls sporulation, competence, biofilm development) n=1 Tax=Mucilaginibacter pineti TaxID=1391627 RepID=A0A1G7FME9_9SPHI|nr:regulatory iron-sulfur-containing complex subunit RicT [Mucilaginibacter pineti]SDE77040.1 Cell fate regulator YaaT, PSP1 superfamily (controls sporulation, competence, biofilm development) [Mucilaginibacter pineti]